MGLLSAFADAINREYDRRIKRASLITEYGAQHHDHSTDHADETPAAADHAAEEADEEAAEITNIAPGTPMVAVAHMPAAEASAEPDKT
jgi:hypothetical protein